MSGSSDRYHINNSHQPSTWRGKVEADLGEDILFLNPGDSSVVMDAVDFQKWREAETDEDILMMNSEPLESFVSDRVGSEFSPTMPNTLLGYTRSDQHAGSYHQVSNQPASTSNSELQYLLDQLPAPDAQDSYISSETPSLYQSGRMSNISTVCFHSGQLHSGNLHFAPPVDHDEPHTDQDQAPFGLQDVEELRTLVRVREREVAVEREKADSWERAFSAAKLEAEQHTRWKEEFEKRYDELSSAADDLKQKLARATSTIEDMQCKSRQLQDQLLQKEEIIGELQSQIKALQVGEAMMKAVQYEHHLAQEADQHRAELLCARQDADRMRLDVALLREQLHNLETEQDRERAIAPKQILTFPAAVQTEVVVQDEFLAATILALQCEIEHLATRKDSPNHDAAQSTSCADLKETSSKKKKSCIFLGLQNELQDLQALNEKLIQANKRLLLAQNHRACAVNIEKVGYGQENTHLLSRIAVLEEEKMNLESAVRQATEKAIKEERERFEQVELQLKARKEAEIDRLRSAWTKNTAESIKAVELRCAAEQAKALQELRRDLISKNDSVDAICQTHPNELLFRELRAGESELAQADEREKMQGRCVDFSIFMKMPSAEIDELTKLAADTKSEICCAVGIDSHRVKMKGLRAGSSWIDMTILELDGNERGPMNIYQDIKAQFSDQNSNLFSGKLMPMCIALQLRPDDQHEITFRDLDHYMKLWPEIQSRTSCDCLKISGTEISCRTSFKAEPVLQEQQSFCDEEAGEQHLRRGAMIERLNDLQSLREQLREETTAALTALRKQLELDREFELDQCRERELRLTEESLKELQSSCRIQREEVLVSCREEFEADLRREISLLDSDFQQTSADEKEALQRCMAEQRAVNIHCADISASIRQEEAELKARLDELARAKEEVNKELDRVLSSAETEAQVSLAKDLEIALSKIRAAHREELSAQRAKEDLSFQKAVEDLRKSYAIRLSEEKARLSSKAVAAAHDLELSLNEEHSKALDSLKGKLAKERQEASRRLLTEAISAAEVARNHTQSILREALQKEVDAERKVHLRQREQVRSILEQEYRAAISKIDSELKEQHARQVEAARVDALAAVKREQEQALMDMRSKVEVELEKEKERLRLEAESRKSQLIAQSGAAISDLKAQLAAEEKAVNEQIQIARTSIEMKLKSVEQVVQTERERLERQLQEELRGVCVAIRKEAEDKVNAVRLELRGLVSIDTTAMEENFSCALSTIKPAIYSAMRRGIDQEIKMLSKAHEKEVWESLEALRSSADEDCQRILDEIRQRCYEQRNELLARAAADLQEELCKARKDADLRQAAVLADRLASEEAELAEKQKAALEQVRHQQAFLTQEALEKARKEGRKAVDEALRNASEEFENSLRATLLNRQQQLAAASDVACRAELQRLCEERAATLERLRADNAEQINRMESQLRAQMAEEAVRRTEALERSCSEHSKKMVEEVRREAKARLEQETQQLQEQAREERLTVLAELERELLSQMSLSLEQVNLEAKRSQDLAEQLLRRECNQQRESALADLQGRLDLELAQEESRLRKERAAELRARLVEEARRLEAERLTTEENLRASLAEESTRALEALRAEHEIRRAASLHAAEQECEHALRLESEKLHKEAEQVVKDRLAALRAEHARAMEEEEERSRLRAGLDLARELAALRSECTRDLERCRSLLTHRGLVEADMAAAALRARQAKPRAEGAVRLAARRDAERREAVEAARNEWRSVLASAVEKGRAVEAEAEAKLQAAVHAAAQTAAAAEVSLSAACAAGARELVRQRALEGKLQSTSRDADGLAATLFAAQRRADTAEARHAEKERELASLRQEVEAIRRAKAAQTAVAARNLRDASSQTLPLPEHPQPIAGEAEERMRLGCRRVLSYGLTLRSEARAAAAPCESAVVLPGTVAGTAAGSAVRDLETGMFSCLMSLIPLSIYRPLAAESTDCPVRGGFTPRSGALSMNTTIAAETPSRPRRGGVVSSNASPKSMASSPGPGSLVCNSPSASSINLTEPCIAGANGEERVFRDGGIGRASADQPLILDLERAARRWSALLSQALFQAHPPHSDADAAATSKAVGAGECGRQGGYREGAERREALSPGYERDRQLFSMLRRSSTRRSLAKSFAASAPSVPRSVT